MGQEPPRYFSVKNFEKFQHYKDREPPWIKLHRSIIFDYEFCKLADSTKAHLMLIWMIASQSENRLPNDAVVIQRMIAANEPVNLSLLFDLGFLIPWRPLRRSRWASRYVSAEVRLQIHQRDQFKCVDCGSQNTLEIDHVIPISKGGTSDPSNLVTRCRICNRAKRIRYADTERSATQIVTSEAEAEAEAEAETERGQARPVAPKPRKPAAVPLSDSDWLLAIKANPAYKGIDVDRELAKLDAWLLDKPHLKKTRRRVMNWLNKAEHTMHPTPMKQSWEKP